jgi:alpha-N-arabinofuranosidase
MKLNPILASLVALAAMAASLPARAEDEPVAVRIDVADRSAPVSPYLYGMFIEPIRNLVGRTLWAEMLDDRKFYAPVLPASADAEVPPPANGPPGLGSRKWRPVGGDDAVAMDRADPFAGAHSPRVAVGSEPKGLAQGGIGIAEGRRYEGSVWLSGDPGARVQVALVWGDGPAARETIVLPAPGAEWRKAEFAFTGKADTLDARFEITGTGTGAFRVASPSIMPDDNVNGWRADTTALARSLNSGMWRLPGGNFLSNWDWHEALGDRDRRNPMFDHAWSAVQSNDLGMDEWLELTRILEVEPYVTVNAGLGDSNSAAELVEYLNGPVSTYWGGQRAANGHPEPYGVKYWNIGNEPYGAWQVGATSREFFMIKHREFADRMLRRDPTIVLIGSGAMPDQRDPPGVPKINPTLADMRARFGTELDWTYGLFDQAAGTFAGVTEHFYDRAEERPDAPRDVELQEWVRSPANHVRAKADQWDMYRERFPWIDEKGVFLWLDEYAYTGGQPNLKLALAYGMVLQEMLRHSDFMTAGSFTTGASTMDITPTSAALNTTGLVFKFYGEHFGTGTIPVAVSGDAPVPEPQFAMGAEHPLTVSGSPTYPLDVIAALSPDRTTLRIGVVNAAFEPHKLDLGLAHGTVTGPGTIRTLTGASLEARNRVGAAPEVSVSPGARADAGAIELPPLSISVLEFPLAATE